MGKILLFAKDKPFLFFILSVPAFVILLLFVSILILKFSDSLLAYLPNVTKSKDVISGVFFMLLMPIALISFLLIFETYAFLIYNFFVFLKIPPKLAGVMVLNIGVKRGLLNQLIKWRKL